MQARSHTISLYFKMKFYEKFFEFYEFYELYEFFEFQNSIRRLGFLCCLPDWVFCPFTLLTWKNKFWKMKKKMPGDIILHKCAKSHDHMLYCFLDVAHDECHFYFSFWVIFCPFTPLTAWKIKILKDEKNTWWFHHFRHVNQKLWSHNTRFLRYDVWPMGGQMDGQTDRKSDIYLIT